MEETEIRENIEEILKSIGLFEKLADLALLKAITSQLITTKLKDKSSLIYRVAMTIYHSGKYWKNNIIEEIDDPMNIYLKLSENKDFQEKYPEFWSSLNELPTIEQSHLIKTFLSFVCAAYYYLISKRSEN